MEFYNKTGKMAIGSRLRQLSDLMTRQAGRVYAMYGIDMNPKWFPAFYVLSEGKARTITEIAQEIGHSHPSVSMIVKEMLKKGYVAEKKKTGDGRKNFIALSARGRLVREKIQEQYLDVNAAVEKAIRGSQYNLWKAIEEWEFLLKEKTLFERVEAERKLRAAARVSIVDYQPAHQRYFKQLNEEWIGTYFKMEEEDHEQLDHPGEYILRPGGAILMALCDGVPVGTCALLRKGDHYEMAKMAVAPAAKGRGIGRLLAEAIIERARAAGATCIFLESNTILKPAISLYQKLGFKKITGAPSPYERSNIQMELLL
jgi:ribosomal protein S18 acetylase RimI-like enzyme